MNAQAQTAEMVQPTENPATDYNLCEGVTGDTSLGKPEVLPPELTNNEAFQRIWAENHDLRGALEQSNKMLRKGHSELLEFQESQRKEREFITYKFGEARNLVLRLTSERNSLQCQLEEAMKQAAEIQETPEQRQSENTILTDQRLQRKAYGEQDYATPGSSLSSCETLTHSTCETIRQIVPDDEGPARNKQKEPVNREVCTESETLQGTVDRNHRTEQEFQKKLQEAEARNTQFLQQIADLQEEVSKLRHQVVEKGEESQKQLQSLQAQLEGVDMQIQELKQQLQEAEEALVAKQELIDKLKDEAEKQRADLDTVPVLKAQVEIYRADFLAERKAREKLHAEKERLQEQLNELLRERAMIDEMRNRHSDTLRPTLPHGPSLYPLPSAMPFQPEVEPPDFSCPKCFYKAPDMDTLQIHVMDCIQ
ncbi:hypothetical protein XELAEV_18002833mg [Xenopus laevis]|nr:hypothetical protein XELAEV_18002833mg [Xenopus laevis]